jgi:hypothetical protein
MQDDPLFELIVATFADLGAGDTPIIRTVLLKGGFFVGYCFHCGDLRAILRPDSAEIEFVGTDGQLLRAVGLPNQEKRNAA